MLGSSTEPGLSLIPEDFQPWIPHGFLPVTLDPHGWAWAPDWSPPPCEPSRLGPVPRLPAVWAPAGPSALAPWCPRCRAPSCPFRPPQGPCEAARGSPSHLKVVAMDLRASLLAGQLASLSTGPVSRRPPRPPYVTLPAPAWSPGHREDSTRMHRAQGPHPAGVRVAPPPFPVPPRDWPPSLDTHVASSPWEGLRASVPGRNPCLLICLSADPATHLFIFSSNVASLGRP